MVGITLEAVFKVFILNVSNSFWYFQRSILLKLLLLGFLFFFFYFVFLYLIQLINQEHPHQYQFLKIFLIPMNDSITFL